MYGRNFFSKLAKKTSRAIGHPLTFLIALTIIIAWGITGPLFHFSDTWQLVINTGTSVTTFLVVFLIQNTQNRDSEAMQLKLDELLRVTSGAHNALLDLEELEEEHLLLLKRKYQALAASAREDLKKGLKDIGSPDVIFD